MKKRNQMTDSNYGETKRISGFQIILVIIIAVLGLTNMDQESRENKKKRSANARNGKRMIDSAVQRIAGISDEELLQKYKPAFAGNPIDDHTGSSLLHVLCAGDRHEVLKQMLMRGAPADAHDKQGDTPLHIAMRNNSDKCVDLLLRNHADIRSKNKDGYSILHAAAVYGYYDVAKAALRAGTPINEAHHSFTPLHSAACNGKLKLVVLLCENGGDIHSRVSQGWTAGDLAFGRYPEIVSYLASKGASFSKDYLIKKYELASGWPFHGHSEIINLSGNHPAFQAIRDDSPDKLAALNHKIIELDITSQSGTPLLILAIANNKFAAAEFLIDYTKKLDEADANGKNALMHSLIVGNKNISRRLIKKGIRLDHIDNAGNSALHYAVEKCENDLVAEMIDKGSDIFAVNHFARGMMHVAAENSNEVIFTTLIANGCDVNQEDVRGNTALHLAAAENNTRILQALLTNGADFAVKNLRGKLAVDLASSQETLQLLRRRFEIEGSNPATRELPAEVRNMTTSTQELVEQKDIR